MDRAEVIQCDSHSWAHLYTECPNCEFMKAQMVSDYPIEPIFVNHLHAMGLGMALGKEEMEDGLSEPQLQAQLLVQDAITKLLRRL